MQKYFIAQRFLGSWILGYRVVALRFDIFVLRY